MFTAVVSRPAHRAWGGRETAPQYARSLFGTVVGRAAGRRNAGALSAARRHRAGRHGGRRTGTRYQARTRGGDQNPRPGFFRHANAKERFLREARAAAVVRHGHAVTIYAVEEINGIPLLVMELVDGVTLEEYLRASGKLSASEVVGLAYQMAQGLAAAHKRGLIHRDVKPANILLEKVEGFGLRVEGKTADLSDLQPSTLNSQLLVKIADFGLARVLVEAGLTNSGLIVGTPRYMSPEQAEGQELDARSDLFSLGSVMYSMCAGRAAFEADSAVAILRQVADKPAPSLREVSPETPGWLIAMIEKLMAKSPDQRFQSAAEVAELLGRHHHDIQAAPPATNLAVDTNAVTAKPTTSTPTRHPRRVVTLVALVLAGIAAAAIGINFKSGLDDSTVTEHSDSKSRVTDAASPSPSSGVPAPPSTWHGWPADAPAPAIAPFNATEAAEHQAAWAKYLGVKADYANSIGMQFILIPPGEFMMGGTSAEIEVALNTLSPNANHWQAYIRSEGPQHRVILTQPVYLGVHEVTQAEYEKVIGTNPSHFAATGAGKDAAAGMETAGHPVEMVSWNDAAEFCAKLSQQEQFDPSYLRDGETVTAIDGTGYRLPSEAEWEFACRAGTTTRFWSGDQDEDLAHVGWFLTNSGGRTQAVGELQASPFGLYDMHGNVWEWLQDGWGATSYGELQESLAVNPSVRFSGSSQRVVRGGYSNDNAFICRASIRAPDDPAYRTDRIGFRVLLPVDAVRQASK